MNEEINYSENDTLAQDENIDSLQQLLDNHPTTIDEVVVRPQLDLTYKKENMDYYLDPRKWLNGRNIARAINSGYIDTSQILGWEPSRMKYNPDFYGNRSAYRHAKQNARHNKRKLRKAMEYAGSDQKSASDRYFFKHQLPLAVGAATFGPIIVPPVAATAAYGLYTAPTWVPWVATNVGLPLLAGETVNEVTRKVSNGYYNSFGDFVYRSTPLEKWTNGTWMEEPTKFIADMTNPGYAIGGYGKTISDKVMNLTDDIGRTANLFKNYNRGTQPLWNPSTNTGYSLTQPSMELMPGHSPSLYADTSASPGIVYKGKEIIEKIKQSAAEKLLATNAKFLDKPTPGLNLLRRIRLPDNELNRIWDDVFSYNEAQKARFGFALSYIKPRLDNVRVSTLREELINMLHRTPSNSGPCKALAVNSNGNIIFYGSGLTGRNVRSTAAHEFRHDVQKGFNGNTAEKISNPRGSQRAFPGNYSWNSDAHKLSSQRFWENTNLLNAEKILSNSRYKGEWVRRLTEFDAELAALREQHRLNVPWTETPNNIKRQMARYLSNRFGISKREVDIIATDLANNAYKNGGKLPQIKKIV